jgi:hypothetical protein
MNTPPLTLQALLLYGTRVLVVTGNFSRGSVGFINHHHHQQHPPILQMQKQAATQQ